jgi:hypothetical protein
MTFVDAIKTCFKKYVDFKGRAGKSHGEFPLPGIYQRNM